MKADARQIDGILRNPAAYRLILLHGDDEGLIRERAQQATQAAAGSLTDPFLVAELTRENWPQISAEMAALSMIGGRRVVRVRDATEAVMQHVTAAMKGPGGALLVLEAPGLSKGKLRSFAEADRQSAAIACYPEEGRALTELIRSTLAAWKITIEPEATAWLSETLGGDRAVVRGELEKLALLVGPGNQLDLEAARACTAGSATDDIMQAACLGDAVAADRAIEASLADGQTGVGILRIALIYLQKLHIARLRMDQGMAISEAVKAMRPPVFFKAATAMANILSLWSSESLLRALEEARQLELACKQTGSRPELLARRFIASLARQARARRR